MNVLNPAGQSCQDAWIPGKIGPPLFHVISLSPEPAILSPSPSSPGTHSSTSAPACYSCLRDRVNADLGLQHSLSKNNNESPKVGVSLNLSSSIHIPEFVPSSIGHLQNQVCYRSMVSSSVPGLSDLKSASYSQLITQVSECPLFPLVADTSKPAGWVDLGVRLPRGA